jgi:mRNA interferase MazF
MFQPGEVVIAAFPFSSLTGIKRRPCLVLAAGDTADDFVVAFITSITKTSRLPSATLIEPRHPAWSQTGLKAASVIRADKLVTLNGSVISGAIGALPPDTLAHVREKLKALFQLL